MAAGRGEGAPLTGALQRAEREARVRSSGIGIPAHPAKSAPRSGVMPDARGLVLCPYCRKTYPFSQALLNRQLRCSGCKAVFRVAEDRRSFRIQESSPPAKPETGRISRSTRIALEEANADLKEIAAQAMRQLTSRDQVRPSSTSEPAHLPTAAVAGQTSRIRSSPLPSPVTGSTQHRAPVLSGAGVAAGRRQRSALLVIGGLVVLVSLAAWALQPDQRRDALWSFQGASRLDQSWAERVVELRRRSLGGSVSPIVAIDQARLGPPIMMPLASLSTAIGLLRRINRSPLWADGARLGEATALLEKTDLDRPGALAGLSARCAKAGITVRTTDDLLTEAEAGLPSGADDVWRLLLEAPAPRGGGPDPAALLGEGRLPDDVSISAFTGESGQLLQSNGPPRTVAYAGRLIRCRGAGWPDGWRVLDLQQVTPGER